MIKFVTDMREGEIDILSPVMHEALLISSLDGDMIEQIKAPAAGWTHDALEAHAERLIPKTVRGAVAFLGSSWVGSTEV